jgi:uncharacterized protein YprB with RNaseH-like and TPR domain
VADRLRRLLRVADRPRAVSQPVAPLVVAPALGAVPPPRPRRSDPSRPTTNPPTIPRHEVLRSGTRYLHGEATLPPDQLHGGLPLSRVLELDGSAALLLSGDAALASFDPCRALFFDLETTGLLGGGGGLAFLVGLVDVRDDGSARLRQLLVRDFEEEPSVLEIVAEALESVSFLVSFNGKAFDRNVLADRFTMHRMDPSRVLELPHLDLLHPARRLFRESLGGCSLQRMEELRLGVFRREDELRGAEVPQRWFDWVHTRRTGLLDPILDHNALDLLSLLTLGADLAACVRAPGVALPEPRALLQAGRLLCARGEPERGEQVLRLLSRGGDGDAVVLDARRALAVQLVRGKRDPELPEVLEQLLRALRAAPAAASSLGREAGVAELARWERRLARLRRPPVQRSRVRRAREASSSASVPGTTSAATLQSG